MPPSALAVVRKVGAPGRPGLGGWRPERPGVIAELRSRGRALPQH
ncbi:hypothetical protein [Spirilliplanes yamanashiensis]|nr:hypothetical protein [Spirilliplanes yamanashiensis]MDP9818298.1 hypothetical protein [Spirilliplanes yamanashiensis]